MKKKLLYIEDEPFLSRIVKETLELKGFEVMLLPDGRELMSSLEVFKPDLCILDVMLPFLDGFTLGRQVRQNHPRLPLIFLTAKSQTEDLVEGFASGGTDYVKKPFSIEELYARILNQLNLSSERIAVHADQIPDEIRLGCIVFRPGQYELHLPEGVKKLSSREAEVLTELAVRPNQVTDRRDLLLKIWGDDSYFNSRTLDVYIRKLRDYLSAEPQIEIITLKGKGYHFRVGC